MNEDCTLASVRGIRLGFRGWKLDVNRQSWRYYDSFLLPWFLCDFVWAVFDSSGTFGEDILAIAEVHSESESKHVRSIRFRDFPEALLLRSSMKTRGSDHPVSESLRWRANFCYVIGQITTELFREVRHDNLVVLHITIFRWARSWSCNRETSLHNFQASQATWLLQRSAPGLRC